MSNPANESTGQTDGGTRSRILDVAEPLVQVRGFNGFSYANIAAELALTKASLHYHFRGKTELGEALMARYSERFAAALQTIDERGLSAPAKLDAYAGLYADVIRGRRMCLCGMLAAEYQTLPESLRGAVTRFFDANEAWLAKVLEKGRHDGNLRFDGDVRATARSIVGGLEGAMLVARSYDDHERFESAAALLLESFARPATKAAA